eukprot:7422286-Pyramimonas_sp.AAC.1
MTLARTLGGGRVAWLRADMVATDNGTSQCLSCGNTTMTKGDDRVHCYCLEGFYYDFQDEHAKVGANKMCKECPKGATCRNDRIVAQACN